MRHDILGGIAYASIRLLIGFQVKARRNGKTRSLGPAADRMF